MHSLALYAEAMGFEPRVYGQLLQAHTNSNRPIALPVRVPLHHAAPHRASADLNTLPGNSDGSGINTTTQRSIATESSALISYTNYPQTHNHYGTIGDTRERHEYTYLALLASISHFMLSIGLLVGIGYGIAWFIFFWKATAWPAMTYLLETWWHGLVDGITWLISFLKFLIVQGLPFLWKLLVG